jgi:hypothetical protein
MLTASIACVASLASPGIGVFAQRAGGPGPPVSSNAPVVITATAVIRGRVATAAGRPIRSAEVRLRSANGRDSRVVTTDASGSYEIRDLTPGQWTLKASKAGFVSQLFGQNHPLEAPAVIELANGQRFTANVALMRGGAISGQIQNEYGEGIPGARVQAMRTKMVRGERQLAATGETDQTDDRGVFRVYGLPPGSYYVMAALPEHQDAPAGASGSRTYYPGTTTIREAVPVVLGSADEQTITLSIPAARAGVTVSGLVLSSTGTPLPGAFITLMNVDDLATGGRGLIGDADAAGRFVVENVPPGEFIADVMVYQGPDIENMEHAVVPLTVGTSDVSDVSIVTRKSAVLRGTLAASAGSTLPRSFAIGVSVETRGGSRTLQMAATLHDSTALMLPGIAGQGLISVTNLPDGWRLDAIEINGRDVTDSVIDFTGLGGVANVRITITDGAGELNGTVSLRGAPQPASVIVFPDDADRWAYPSRFVRTTRAGSDGRFTISGLPPYRRYRIAAVTFLEEDEFQDPEFLQRIRAAASEVAVADRETKTIDLTPIAR